jgi:catecholate siderophore receptor
VRGWGLRGWLAAGTAGLTLAQAAPLHAAELEVAELTGVEVTGHRPAYDAASTATATRTDTPLHDVPQAVTVITGVLIRDQAMQGMADLVRYVPGVTWAQGEGNRDTPVLRGNSSTADFFVDGVRDDVQYIRDLYNAERVEVLKGPNAMIFGRGGGGGVINRVTRQADWSGGRSLTVEGGSRDHRRLTLDVDEPLSGAVAGRLAAVYERSGSFRDRVNLERWGVDPTLTWRAADDLVVRLGYERFHDDRTADRGLPSFQGRPSPAAASAFFGDPGISYVRADVDLASAALEWTPTGRFTLRNRTLVGSYDKFYQNVFAGAAALAGPDGAPASVPLSAYNNATTRENLFNQTDLIWKAQSGGVRHTLLLGAEVGRQSTDNLRDTGFFNNTATTFSVPFGAPSVSVPVTFRPAAGDADNHVRATVAAIYGQEQAEIGEHLQLIAGLRSDAFALKLHNNRTGEDFARTDHLVSPRLGLVLKPAQSLSLYASYSVSFLPSAGDQFGSLTASTETLKPERFENRELGAKWDPRPGLSLTAAAYDLERSNTTASDPNTPGRIVQTGAQRTRGVELGASGKLSERWEVAGGYAWTDARIVSTTSQGLAGKRVALTPRQAFSLWNKVSLTPNWSVGLGVIVQGRSFAAVDNTVTLPGFTRLDAALFWKISPRLAAQLNVENLADRGYVPTAQGNNNILPGAPRTVRASLTARF